MNLRIIEDCTQWVGNKALRFARTTGHRVRPGGSVCDSSESVTPPIAGVFWHVYLPTAEVKTLSNKALTGTGQRQQILFTVPLGQNECGGWENPITSPRRKSAAFEKLGGHEGDWRVYLPKQGAKVGERDQPRAPLLSAGTKRTGGLCNALAQIPLKSEDLLLSGNHLYLHLTFLYNWSPDYTQTKNKISGCALIRGRTQGQEH